MEVLTEYILGMKRYSVEKEEKAFEILVRRDISEEEIISMMETILLAYPGTVNKSLQSLEISLSSNVVKSTDCQSLRVVLGVKTLTKQRVIVIHFKPNTATKSKIMFLSTSKPLQFLSFVESLMDQCRAALEASGIADGPHTHTLSISLDPGFVRDLQLACAMDMLSSLTKMAEILDFHVTILEKKCAKLMTLLKANYIKAFGTPQGLSSVPIPPTKKSLLDYPLPLSRQSITEPNNDISRTLILRAKRAIDQNKTDDSLKKKEGGNIQYNLDALVNIITNEFMQWAEEESKARTARKTLAVKDRILALEEFRENLIWRLHTRYIREYMPKDVVDGLIVADASLKLTAEDSVFHEKTKGLCRIFCDEEPVILDLPVIMQGRKGTLYLSVNHIFFQPSMLSAQAISPAWFGAIPQASYTSSQPVPLIVTQSIADISISSESGQIIVPNILTPSASLLITTPNISNEEIIIQLHDSIEKIILSVPPLPGTGYSSSDYGRRLADFISILVKVNFYKKSRALLSLPVLKNTDDFSIFGDLSKQAHIRLKETHEEQKRSTANPFDDDNNNSNNDNIIINPNDVMISTATMNSNSLAYNPFDQEIEAISNHQDNNNDNNNDSISHESSIANQSSNPTVKEIVDIQSFEDKNPFDDIQPLEFSTMSVSDTKMKESNEGYQENTTDSSRSSMVIHQSPFASDVMNSVEVGEAVEVEKRSSPQLISEDISTTKKTSLAKNIQAFLAQNQQKK